MIDEKEKTWIKALEAKGHKPVLTDEWNLDRFVCSGGHHNGPGCSVCGWDCCWHCHDVDSIPECTKVAPPPYISPDRALIAELVEALKETTDCLRDIAEGKGGWAWETVLDHNLDLLTKAKAMS